MREIKFRAWNIKRRRWVSPMEFHNAIVFINWNTTSPNTGEFQFHDDSITGHDDLILEQFTGLKDKNGVEIYEGDIVKYTRVKWECIGHPEHLTDLVQIHKIYWDDERHGFCDSTTYKTGGGASGALSFQDNRAKENIIEIIGNIHENPELLKD